MTFPSLTHIVGAAARRASRRPKLTIFLWLLLVVGCTALGAASGMRTLSNSASETGQSAHADARLKAAGMQAPALESVLITSSSPTRTAVTATALERQARTLPTVRSVSGPAEAGTAMLREDGRAALVQVQLRGGTDNAGDHVAPLERTVADVAGAYPGVHLQEVGYGSVDHAITQIVSRDLGHAEMITLPITLLILIAAFGALVAASVPLLLGITSVAAALGALGAISHLVPTGDSTASVVVLIGLAVGIDYSLFYIRREREERARGADAERALAATAATVGRAVVVAGMTVAVALTGLLFSGLSVFTSMALATIVVVAIAVIGSLTVLPATLALLGDRVDRGRILRRRGTRRTPAPSRFWTGIARAVTGRPWAALITSCCVLGALVVPVLSMHTANPDQTDLPRSTPVARADRAVGRLFPGSPVTANLVITGHGLSRDVAALRRLGAHAQQVTGGSGATRVSVARDGRTALVAVPMPDQGLDVADRVVGRLRQSVLPTAAQIAPGTRAELSGDAASNVDFTNALQSATPRVIAFVLALAFVLLVASFGSPLQALAVIGLNLLSVGAAFGVLVAVFQHHWAQSLIGFHSNGAIVDWLPLFAFVILFGLSMDYTVLVLERVREARSAGADGRTAAMRALSTTGGTVTSAAVVMIAVFSVFATLSLLEFKQLGIGLAVAIALDATIVRAIALPAVLTLLGRRDQRRATPVVRRAVRGWDHQLRVGSLGAQDD